MPPPKSYSPFSSLTNKLIAAAGITAGVALSMLWLDKTYYISKDLKLLSRVGGAVKNIGKYLDKGHTFVEMWQDIVNKDPKKPFMIFEGYSYSYEAIDKMSNMVGNWAIKIGMKPGDTATLMMQNCPEFFAIWMGLMKVGCITALINYNIKKKSLVHSMKISHAKVAIVGKEVMEPVADISEKLYAEGFRIFAWNQQCPGREPLGDNEKNRLGKDNAPILPNSFTCSSFDNLPKLSEIDFQKLRQSHAPNNNGDYTVLLIYTSGTTGLPKAAVIKAYKLMNMTMMGELFSIQKNDRIYTALPLYHSAAGLMGIGMTIGVGATMILRRKFSARAFWNDCRMHKATVVQYIGELCRYLLATPPTKCDAKNKVRVAIGNGLRPDIWPIFQKRFGLPEIIEFYAATEGNIFLMNHCTTPEAQGAVGHMGGILQKLMKPKLAKFNVENETIIRGKDGFAIKCGYNEPGELLGEIKSTDPNSAFAGYLGNKKATQKKIIKDVFVKGDMYFRTGDLLMENEKGYWFFVDRIGDTFRWKGENVSTNEVSEVVSMTPGVKEVNIYGVAISGTDGRACMAAIVIEDQIDWAEFAKHCINNLPAYAVPLFIRLLPHIAVTATFKHQKVKLRKEGIDLNLIKDDILWLDGNTYRPFDQDAWKKITLGKVRL